MGHEDWAGSPTMVQVAPRPRRPTIRHCIGVRSWASSTSTWAKPSSSTRLVGGDQPRGPAYSRSEAVNTSWSEASSAARYSSSTEPGLTIGGGPAGGSAPLGRGVSVVGRAGVDDRGVAEQVAQLVEQRDVVDRELVAPRLGEQ